MQVRTALLDHMVFPPNGEPNHIILELYSFPEKTDYVTGCCLFTTKKVIDQLDGFDEKFKMYGEDVDLCLRARNHGINCFYWPEAKLWHHVSASYGGAFTIKKLSKKIIGIGRLLLKHY